MANLNITEYKSTRYENSHKFSNSHKVNFTVSII